MDDARSRLQHDAQFGRSPVPPRSPRPGLFGDKVGRVFGQIAERVGTRVGGDLVGHRLAGDADTVDGGGGETGRGHGPGLDELTLRIPFVGHQTRGGLRRQNEGRVGRGFGRATIEHDLPAVTISDDVGRLPEALQPFLGLAKALLGGDAGVQRRDMAHQTVSKVEAVGSNVSSSANRFRLASRSAKSAAT